MDCSLPGSSVHGDSLGKNTGVGCLAFLQGIFPTQRLNPCLLNFRQIIYHQSHKGSPRTLKLGSLSLTQESKQGFLHCRQILYQLSYQGRPIIARQCIKRQRHHFADKGPYSQGNGLSSSHVWMWELNHKEGRAPKNWCFWTVVLEKILDNPLGRKEIKPVNLKGNQSWTFIGKTDAKAETPILWPPDASSQLIGKDSDVGKDWRWKEKGATEDEMIGWHHWFNGHEPGQTLGDGEVRESWCAVCSPWGWKQPDMTWQLNNNNLHYSKLLPVTSSKRALGIQLWLNKLSLLAHGNKKEYSPWNCGSVEGIKIDL